MWTRSLELVGGVVWLVGGDVKVLDDEFEGGMRDETGFQVDSTCACCCFKALTMTFAVSSIIKSR